MSITNITQCRQNEWMCIRYGREQTKYLEKNLFQCQYAHHKSHTKWPDVQHGLPGWVFGRQRDYQLSSIKFNPAEVCSVDTYAHSITKVQTYYFIVSASFTALICTLHQIQSLSEIISIVKPTRRTSVSILFYFGMLSTCFGWSFRPSSGVQDCTYSEQTFVRQILLSACSQATQRTIRTVYLLTWWRQILQNETDTVTTKACLKKCTKEREKKRNYCYKIQ